MAVATLDETAKKRVLGNFTYGLYAVGAHAHGDATCFTANWVTQASFDPPLVVICVQTKSTAYKMIEETKVFSVNVLGAHQKEEAARFVDHDGPEDERLAGIRVEQGITGCPVLPDALGWVECDVLHTAVEGDHAVYIGKIVKAVHRRDGERLRLEDTSWEYSG